jgi:hypothetical protein
MPEQQTCAIYILIMFTDAAVGWVLDVSLSEQQTCAIYVDNVHGRSWRLGPRCQTIWTRNVCYVELFSSAWLLANWLLFLNPPMKSKFLKVEDVADRWVPWRQTLWTINVCYLVPGGFYFRTHPLNSNLIRLRDAADGWVPDSESLNITCAIWILFCSPWILATRLLFLNQPMKFDLIKYGWRALLTGGS